MQEAVLESQNYDDVDERRDSVFKIDETDMRFCSRIKVLLTNECFLYLIAAGFFRFFGGYSLGFLSGGFYEAKFPEYSNGSSTYAIMNAVVVIGGGLPASMLGGYLSDKLEPRFGSVKGLIAGLGALTAVPFIVIAYSISDNFWVSIFSYYIAYFLAEMWYGPSHAQINNMFPSEYQGFAVATFNFLGAIAGTIATLLLGWLKSAYDSDEYSDEKNANINGYILTGGVLFSYICCGPLFIISGIKYAN